MKRVLGVLAIAATLSAGCSENLLRNGSDDLSAETVWDKFVIGAVKHYKDRPVIFEIENEPEFDRWLDHKLGDEYAKFTIRTAKLIRAHAPKMKIMVDNVYGIPSPVNGHFFKAGGLKFIDVMSWHDYHEGWLADAQSIRRMRLNMDEAGGTPVELWFNEGWAFTNTAVDEPIACTHLTAAQSVNAHADCVAEMSVSGQKKTILFHLAYEEHGQSFWDYSGPGQMLWDWYGYPLPLAAMWNVLNHHIGISEEVGFVQPPGANIAVFQDLRNMCGVCILYADRESKIDATVDLAVLLGNAPFEKSTLLVEDIMGNVQSAPQKLVLSKTGRPVILYASNNMPGTAFFQAFQPLDRKNASFVTTEAPGAAAIYRLPASWEGIANGKADGNPLLASGLPVWRLDGVFPDRFIMAGNYNPLTWNGTEWRQIGHEQGGQPAIRIANGAVDFSVRGPATGKGLEFQKIAAVVFIAPKSGIYKVSGTAKSKPWEGGAKIYRLAILKKDTQRAAEVKVLELPRDGSRVPFELSLELTAGHEIVFLPLMPDWHNTTTTHIEDLKITAPNP